MVDILLLIGFISYKIYLLKQTKKSYATGDSLASLNTLKKEFRSGKLNFKFDNFEYSLKSGKSILSGITGEIKRGRLTAIMGNVYVVFPEPQDPAEVEKRLSLVF